MSEHLESNAREPRALRAVALGGGTGMPVVLRGLRELRLQGRIEELTAVVTMTDDGGSSGRLRRSRGMPPPGDLRNCLVALSSDEELLAGLFQHRYSGSRELGGHTLGNLILTALAEQSGSFLKAVELSSRVLRTVGRILPATLADVALQATLADGSTVLGETAIDDCGQPIEQMRLVPDAAPPTPGVLDVLAAADIVVLGPGSLYTSLLPVLVIDGVVEALARSRAMTVLVANLVSEAGHPETTVSIELLLEAIHRHAGRPVIDGILVHEGEIDAEHLRRYGEEGCSPVTFDPTRFPGVVTLRRPLLADGEKLRHDPTATAEGIVDLWQVWSERGSAAVLATETEQRNRMRGGGGR